MSSEPSGNMVFDTGPLLELVQGSPAGEYVRSMLRSDSVRSLTSELNLGELRYLVCRKASEQKSKQAVDNLIQSGYLGISPVSQFLEQAADLKCRRSISFLDCFVLSMGESMHAKVLFATREKEILKEMKKEPFKTEIAFLSDLVSS